MDREQRSELVDNIRILLGDRSIIVLGSAVIAWNQVCPDRYDLLHENFRKICHFLADIEEWGQVVILEVLLRYGRTQFLDPNKEVSKFFFAKMISPFFFLF